MPATVEVGCTRCGRALPPWRYQKLVTGGSCPDGLAQPCKDCRPAGVAASLAAGALAICERHHFESAVMLLGDLLDVLNDPEEVAQAGRAARPQTWREAQASDGRPLPALPLPLAAATPPLPPHPISRRSSERSRSASGACVADGAGSVARP
ncbi:MAG: hypothetical protein ACRDZO_03425 [Egibacteraceae bacterium]